MPRSNMKTKTKAQPKRGFLPLGLALLGIGLVLLALFALRNNGGELNSGDQAGGAPRLQVDQERIDHGDVKLGTTQRSVVKVSNTGDQPLRFSAPPYIEVKAGC